MSFQKVREALKRSNKISEIQAILLGHKLLNTRAGIKRRGEQIVLPTADDKLQEPDPIGETTLGGKFE